MDNSRTDEKMVTTKPEAEKTEAPKKKKNIITNKINSKKIDIIDNNNFFNKQFSLHNNQ